METPYLEIDLVKLKENALKLNELFINNKMDILCITKCHCANLAVIGCLKEVGIKHFGDSRLLNIKQAKKYYPELSYTMIRIPKLSELEEVLEYCDCSLQSELITIKKIAELAKRQNKVHNIILMVDVGDLREGVMIEDALETIKEILEIEGVCLKGIGTNVGCYGSIMPTVENTQILVDIKKQVKEELNYDLEFISGGATCTTKLLFEGKLDPEVNLLRIGEAILFGEDSTNDKKIEGYHDDVFTINAEVIELKNKPSMPIGERGKDAFGRVVEYTDYGNIDRAILAIGRQDVIFDALEPLDKDINILGGSGDHMILDVTKSKGQYQIGDIISFRCSYSALLSASTSKYVNTKIKEQASE